MSEDELYRLHMLEKRVVAIEQKLDKLSTNQLKTLIDLLRVFLYRQHDEDDWRPM